VVKLWTWAVSHRYSVSSRKNIVEHAFARIKRLDSRVHIALSGTKCSILTFKSMVEFAKLVRLFCFSLGLLDFQIVKSVQESGLDGLDLTCLLE
jgi:biotin synthase-like enzyme